MKRVLPAILFFLILFSGSSFFRASAQNTGTCSFVPPNLYVTFWDSCTNSNHSINGYATLGNCFKYAWKVNGVLVSTSRMLNYQVTQNGTYTVCLTVVDTCRNCDTTICNVRTFNCFPASSPCMWGTAAYAYFWDTCNTAANHYSLNGYAVFNPCYKYQWKVNGVPVSTNRILNYPVNAPGTYNVCLAITDTCRRCDTLICSTRVLNCPPPNVTCQWAPPTQYVTFWDSCSNTNRSLNGYAYFNSCYKYLWKVNGVVVGTTRTLNYPVTQNGTYSVCLTITDTCRRCDTVICSTRTIQCIPANTPCNFNTPNLLYTNIWDSCTNTTKAIYGYATFNSCFKYLWKINGVVVGTTRMLTYPVTQNGTYTVCLTITDTCRRCDTVICSTRTIQCFPTTTCRWTTTVMPATFWDSCTNTSRSLNGSAIQHPCFKYQWKVNGVLVSTSRTLHYPVTQNGTYNVCLTIRDTCMNCDTTICSIRTINCIPTNVPCRWAPATQFVTFWDSCTNSSKSLNGYAYFYPCFKYQWRVNGVLVGTTRTLHYPVTQNGTYTVCLTLIDTCRRCDTVICSTRVINCTTPAPCSWAGRAPLVYYWDTCTAAKKSLNAYVSPNTTGYACLKYVWKVNNVVVGTGPKLNYPVTQNGTYNVCLAVTDTCRRCDTVICSTRVLNCNPPPCTWTATTPYAYFWDSCTNTSKSLHGYAVNNPCFKYQWKVNGVLVSTSRTLNYPVAQNGNYYVCLTLTDTCRRCDTTICSIRTINCPTTTPGCSWSGRNPYVYFWDTCTTAKRSLNAYVSPNSAGFGCYKFIWKVNNVVVGTGPRLNYPVAQNGTYAVCLTVVDTCRRCDTTICSIRVLNCGPTIAPCAWSAQRPYVHFWDSCATSAGGNYSLNGYIAFNSNTAACYKYLWKVNGQPVGTGRWLNYPITENGTYTVCVTVSDTCRRCDTTFCSIRAITCVNELVTVQAESQLKIFENPTTGLVNVDWSEDDGAYMLTSSTGQVLESGRLLNGTQLLDLSGYPNGLYLLKVLAPEGMLTRKIYLQKY